MRAIGFRVAQTAHLPHSSKRTFILTNIHVAVSKCMRVASVRARELVLGRDQESKPFTHLQTPSGAGVGSVRVWV